MDFCVTGLASFMIGISTLSVMVFFADCLHQRVNRSNGLLLEDPALATAFCELPDLCAAFRRRLTNDLAGAIEASQPGYAKYRQQGD